MADGHRFGVDHGLTFHSDHKLRTVPWCWIGETLNAEELTGIDRVLSGLGGELRQRLAELLTDEEMRRLSRAAPGCVGRTGSQPQWPGRLRCPGRCSNGMTFWCRNICSIGRRHVRSVGGSQAAREKLCCNSCLGIANVSECI